MKAANGIHVESRLGIKFPLSSCAFSRIKVFRPGLRDVFCQWRCAVSDKMCRLFGSLLDILLHFFQYLEQENIIGRFAIIK